MGHSYLHLRYNATIFRYCENTHLCSKYTNVLWGWEEYVFPKYKACRAQVFQTFLVDFQSSGLHLPCQQIPALQCAKPNSAGMYCAKCNTCHIATGRQLPTYFTYRSCPAMETHTMKLPLQCLC